MYADSQQGILAMCYRPVSHLVGLLLGHLDSPRGDRSFKGDESRRIGVYHVACLSLKCYFKVSNSTAKFTEGTCGVQMVRQTDRDIQVGKPNLCKNIIRAVTSDAKTPPIDEAPLADQVSTS